MEKTLFVDHAEIAPPTSCLPCRTSPTRRRRIALDEDLLHAVYKNGIDFVTIAASCGVSAQTIANRFAEMGLPTRRTGMRAGMNNPQWNGGKCLDSNGYVTIYAPLHPMAMYHGRLYEHRLLMECLLERYVLNTEVVHHRDDDPSHNWPNNLEIFSCNADHLKHELSGREYATSPRSISDVARSNRASAHYLKTHDTLAQCPEEIRQKLAYYIESFRPTIEQRIAEHRSILRLGAWRHPFLLESTEQCIDLLP